MKKKNLCSRDLYRVREKGLRSSWDLDVLAGRYAISDVHVDKFCGEVDRRRQPVDDLHGVQAHVHAHEDTEVPARDGGATVSHPQR